MGWLLLISNNTDLLHCIRFTRNDKTIINKLFFSRLLICQYSFHQRTPLCPLGKKPWCILDGKPGGLVRLPELVGRRKLSTPAGNQTLILQ
jgi:hypothetical protein